MAQVPRINPTRNTLDTRGPGVELRQKDTSGDVLSILGNTVADIGESFRRANLLAEQTKADNSYNTRMADIEQRAAQETDLSKEKQQSYRDEIEQARSDSSEFITTPEDRSLFDLQLKGKSDVSKIRVDSVFQKKGIDDLKANLEISLDNSQNNFIKANNPKDKASAILERNTLIQKAVGAKLLEPAEATKQIAKLDHDWAMAQVNYDITINPEIAEEGLSKKEYPNIDEADRVDLLSKASLAIRNNKREVDDQIELAQISTQSDYLSKFANGEAGWMTLSDVARDVRGGILPEKFGSAYADVIKAQGEYEPSAPENMNYPTFISAIYEAKDKKELQTALYNLLKDHKNISQEKLSVLINGALQRGKALGLRPAQIDPKQQEVDSAAQAVVSIGRRNGMSNNDISDIYQNFNKDITAGKTPKEALDNATRTNALKNNPALLNLPAEGKMMIDSNGSKAIVFPDGSYKTIDGSGGSGGQKPNKPNVKKD